MTAKLILLGGGKMILTMSDLLSEDAALTIREAFKEWSRDPKDLIAILGVPVEVIDNSHEAAAPELSVV